MQRNLVGASGPLTDVGPINVTVDGTHYENLRISGGIDLDGHTGITMVNCEIIGPLPPVSNGTYTVRMTDVGGSLDMTRCTIITRASNARGVACTNTGTLRMTQCKVLGGTDAIVVNAFGTTNLFEGYAVVIRETYVGDLMDPDGDPHSDAFQTDRGDGAGTLIERCRIESFNISPGQNPQAESANPATAETGNAAITATQNSMNPGLIARVDIIDNWVDGGNYTVYMSPSDGITPTGGTISGNRFGTRHNFGPFIPGPNDDVSSHDNVWGASGITDCCGVVDSGTLVPNA